jgi:hypothetical protein
VQKGNNNQTNKLNLFDFSDNEDVFEQPTRVVTVNQLNWEETSYRPDIPGVDHTSMATVVTRSQGSTEPLPAVRCAEFIPSSGMSAGDESTRCHTAQPEGSPGVVVRRLGGALKKKPVGPVMVVASIVALGVFSISVRQDRADPVEAAQKVAPVPQRDGSGSKPTPEIETTPSPGTGSTDPSTPEETVRLKDAVDALVSGRIEESRGLYLLLADANPDNRSYELAATLLDRMSKRTTR